MAATVSEILVKFKDSGANTVGAAFKRITKEARGVERSFQRLSDQGVRDLRIELDRLKNSGVNSIASMKAQKNALMALRDMANVTGAEFKQLTADISRMDAALAKSQGRKQGGFSGRAGAVAKTAGAVAGAGIYGGAEGVLGASIGGIIGGAPGAITGGVVGAQVGMLRESISGIAEFSASLALQRKALRLVIGDMQQYEDAQKFLAVTSKKLAIPQQIITRQFTSLTASVKGAGKSTEDAQIVFEAIAAGIRGTGGSLEDMKAAMRATSQVFSKGKVSAEELRQQLGERLPGAFTLFAESMDKTPAELDKALEQGKVTLDDFMKFANTLFKRYGENAKILADSPAAAGDRLQTALSVLRDNIGQLLSPIGAEFQDTFTLKIIEPINDATEALMKFYKVGEKFREDRLRELIQERESLEKRIEGIKLLIPETGIFDFPVSKGTLKNQLAAAEEKLQDLLPRIKELKLLLKDGLIPIKPEGEKGGDGGGGELSDKDLQKNLDFIEKTRQAEEKAEQEKYNAFLDFQLLTGQITQEKFDQIKLDQQAVKLSKQFGVNLEDVRDLLQRPIEYEGVMAGIKDYFDSIKTGAEEVRAAVTSAFKNMENAIVNFVMTGKLNFAEFTRSILADMARIIVRQAFIKPLLGAIFPNFADGGVVENAMGNVYGSNGIQKFARGGVVHSPTIFPFKNGIGLMGEAGSEAILPLKRTKQGKLGVESSGGGGNVVNVSVDAGGTSAQGNTMKANQLGKMIGTAIEAELIKQKRPGGILYT
jgi:lambda family phage tail tape measure protein